MTSRAVSNMAGLSSFSFSFIVLRFQAARTALDECKELLFAMALSVLARLQRAKLAKKNELQEPSGKKLT